MGKITSIAKMAAVGGALTWLARSRREQREMDFAGRVVLITGGSRGLGLVLARQFAEEGAKLAIVARTAADLAHAAQELAATGVDVLAFPCDVTDQEQVNNAIDRVVEHYGRLDVVINNAGHIAVGPLDHQKLSDFETSINVHFYGPLYTMRAAIPHMRKQGGGRIVNISSIGGKVAVPHLVPYSAGKFALVGLSDGFRAELGKDNILVTTVAPGLIRTGSPPNVTVKGQHQKEYAWFAVGDALPLVSKDAEATARQIVEACRYGDPALTISTQARVAEIIQNLAPSVIANVMAITNRFLPQPTGAEGDRAKTGWESQSAVAPSALTALSDQATVDNNELRGRDPGAIEQSPVVNED